MEIAILWVSSVLSSFFPGKIRVFELHGKVILETPFRPKIDFSDPAQPVCPYPSRTGRSAHPEGFGEPASRWRLQCFLEGCGFGQHGMVRRHGGPGGRAPEWNGGF